MSNNFYNHGTFPSRDAPGSSAALKAELDLIGAGFEKMPPLTGNGGKFVRVNVLGTALEVTSDLTAATINGVVIGGTTPAAGTFTTLAAASATITTLGVSGNATIGGNLDLTGNFTVGGTFQVPTLPFGSSGNYAASVDYINGVVINAAIPGAAGNGGKELVSDNTSAAWGYSGKRVARTSNTILVQADNRKFIDITSGTFTQTFTAAATLGDGWTCFIRNAGTGRITIPSSDGLTNWIMYPGESRLFQCDGTNFYSCWITPFYVELSTTETFIKPPGYMNFDVEGWGAGAGGGSGACYGAATVKTGGGGGGGGGYCRRLFASVDIAATVAVTIGAGGAGGAGRSTDGDGNIGVNGGNTTFGTYLTVTGGIAGNPGTNASVAAAAGGNPLGVAATSDFTGNTGAGTTSAGSAANAAGGRVLAGCGGGGGAGESVGNALQTSGAGGARNVTSGGGGTAGTSSAGAPTSGGIGGNFQGGGGGGSSQSAAAGAGGAGGRASGGGGGGTSRTTFLSGAGGRGGDGYAIIRGV